VDEASKSVLTDRFEVRRAIATGVLDVVVEAVAFVPDRRGAAHRRNGTQEWPLRYLDAPALVVIEVEVKSIESVRRNLIDQPTDRLDVEEMTSHVQVNTAPREARPVFNEEPREFERVERRGARPEGVRPQLAKDRESVRDAGRSAGVDCDLLVDRQAILLVAAVVHLANDHVRRRRAVTNSTSQPIDAVRSRAKVSTTSRHSLSTDIRSGE